jgi:hypothetical protein
MVAYCDPFIIDESYVIAPFTFYSFIPLTDL